MASGINKVMLLGNLGKEPEMHTFDNGVKKVSFPLATNEPIKNKDGQRIDHTEWHNIVMWRGLAETAEKYLHKGDQIFIEGRLRTRSYEENGVKKYFTEILADSMTMLGSKRDSQPSGPDTSSYSSPAAENIPDRPEGDLPF
ncbi:MAG: single-stranded DNA-binding protein [Bacteroidales bacterium]|jgi:single-strand DNA-binding protein|nr:single-stranded DNA-binding protein [Bacteroidales bacterium]